MQFYNRIVFAAFKLNGKNTRRYIANLNRSATWFMRSIQKKMRLPRHTQVETRCRSFVIRPNEICLISATKNPPFCCHFHSYLFIYRLVLCDLMTKKSVCVLLKWGVFRAPRSLFCEKRLWAIRWLFRAEDLSSASARAKPNR